MKEQIMGYIRKACALEEKKIEEGTAFRDLSLDSLSFLVMLVDIETEFGFEFEDEELNWENWTTVGELIRQVERRTHAKAGS